MTRDLLLLRSGKSDASWTGAGRKRPLKDRGKRQVQRIGVWLSEQGLIPDRVIAPPTERAQVSAQKALKAAGIGADRITCDARLNRTATSELRAALAEFGGDDGLAALVLQRKGMAALLGFLCKDGSYPAIGPGTLLRLSLPETWSDLTPGCAEIVEIVRPEELPERFPFDGPNGREWRDRPAYYYTQSAVIPYRQGASGLEIMVITSSKRNHWVVPKGIHDPGYSAQASAAHEAREEAGVLGEVDPEPAGQFELEKWGATCRVTVYPMRVTEVIGTGAWDESHRSRLWVTPEQAVRQLKHEGLARIVRDFARTRSA